MKSVMALIGVLFALFVTTPIWFYLLYQILVAVQATQLMFFLFWIYVPTTFFVQLIAQLLQKGERK